MCFIAFQDIQPPFLLKRTPFLSSTLLQRFFPASFLNGIQNFPSKWNMNKSRTIINQHTYSVQWDWSVHLYWRESHHHLHWSSSHIQLWNSGTDPCYGPPSHSESHWVASGSQIHILLRKSSPRYLHDCYDEVPKHKRFSRSQVNIIISIHNNRKMVILK